MSEEEEGVLVIGSAESMRRAAREGARALGVRVREESTLSGGLRAVAERAWPVTLLAYEVLAGDRSLLGRIVAAPNAGAVVLVAQRPSSEQVIEAMRAGVFELLAAPLEGPAVERVLRLAAGRSSRIALPSAQSEQDGESIGSSPALLDVFKSVGRVAASAATVLVTGESGTGKELIARSVHRASDRSAGPLVAVNCAAIPEDLLESELFGHERGAFTGAITRKLGRFERASGGTLFLDEIGDMSLVLQAKILRALQEREIERLGGEERIPVDVRVVAATHRNLARLIEEGEFREDLFYRLAVVRLHLPPLRERGSDLRELALHYTARFAAEHGRPLRHISVGALDRLEAHPWPGNIRELRNVIERGVLTAQGDTLREEDLQIDHPRRRPSGEPLPGYAPTLSLAEVEALHIGRVLEAVDGHLGRAAEILGMHRNTVSRKAQEYGIRTG